MSHETGPEAGAAAAAPCWGVHVLTRCAADLSQSCRTATACADRQHLSTAAGHSAGKGTRMQAVHLVTTCLQQLQYITVCASFNAVRPHTAAALGGFPSLPGMLQQCCCCWTYVWVLDQCGLDKVTPLRAAIWRELHCVTVHDQSCCLGLILNLKRWPAGVTSKQRLLQGSFHSCTCVCGGFLVLGLRMPCNWQLLFAPTTSCSINATAAQQLWLQLLSMYAAPMLYPHLPHTSSYDSTPAAHTSTGGPYGLTPLDVSMDSSTDLPSWKGTDGFFSTCTRCTNHNMFSKWLLLLHADAGHSMIEGLLHNTRGALLPATCPEADKPSTCPATDCPAELQAFLESWQASRSQHPMQTVLQPARLCATLCSP
jgi:hypothetical protein